MDEEDYPYDVKISEDCPCTVIEIRVPNVLLNNSFIKNLIWELKDRIWSELRDLEDRPARIARMSKIKIKPKTFHRILREEWKWVVDEYNKEAKNENNKKDKR